MGAVLAASLGLLGCCLSLVFASPAGAFGLAQCEGIAIEGQGGGLQALAEGSWTKEFNLSGNADACNGTQGSLGLPPVVYKATTGAVSLTAWATKEEYGAFPFISKGFPPTLAVTKKLEDVAKFPARANTLLTIPVAQTAIAVVVHLPASCVATSTPAAGRLVMTNATLEAVLRGAITTWSAISDSGDTVSGGGCSPATPITRVVPKEAADPEAIVKKYLFEVNGAKVWEGTKTWQQIAEVTKWPNEKVDPVVRQLNVAGYVAEHASTIGIAWIHPARPLFGAPGHGAGTERFWVEVQDGVNAASEPVYADPANNGDVEATGNSNCKETTYVNGGKALPSTLESWNLITAKTEEPHYTVCGLSYLFALNAYSLYSGAKVPPSEAQARTVHDYLNFVVNVLPEGGQPIIGAFGTDYGKLPPEIFSIARPGVETINF